jgi:hypothetical protein
MNLTKHFFTLTFTPLFWKEWKSKVTGAGFDNKTHKVCLNSKFPPILHSTLEIQPATLFGEKCIRLYFVFVRLSVNFRFYNSKF